MTSGQVFIIILHIKITTRYLGIEQDDRDEVFELVNCSKKYNDARVKIFLNPNII